MIKKFILGLSLLLLLVFLFILYGFTGEFWRGDYAGYLGRIWFLSKYGYGNVPNWYNGFNFYSHYPPLFFTLAAPFYIVTNDIVLSMYMMVVLVVLIGLALCLFFRKYIGGLYNSLLLFAVMFTNPFSFYYFMIGRIPEMLGWTFLVPVLLILFKSWREKLTRKDGLLLFVFISLIIFTHVYAYVASWMAILFVFVFSKKKNRTYIGLATSASLLIGLVWIIPFIGVFRSTVGGVPINSSIPVIGYIPLYSYGLFSALLIGIFLIKYGQNFSFLLHLGLIIFILVGAYGISKWNPTLGYYPSYLNMAKVSLFIPQNQKFVALPEDYLSRVYSVYDYAAIYGNESTPFGHFPQLEDLKTVNLEVTLNENFSKGDCNAVRDIMNEINAKYIVTKDAYCNQCFNKTEEIGTACLLSVFP